MRMIAQVRLGYFPAPPEAMAELLKHLRVRPPDPEKKSDTVCMIDPCCGKGAAIQQIAEGLGVLETQVYGQGQHI